MASQFPPKKGAAFTLGFTLYKNDGTLINPSTVTKYISKDGAAAAAMTNSVTEINATYGMLSVVLTATEMNADRIQGYITATVTDTVPYTFTIYTASYTVNDVYGQIPTVAEITASIDKTGYSLTASYTKYPALAASLSTAITGINAIPTTPLLAASYTTPPTVAAITASVWGNSSRTLSDKTGFALTASYTKYPALAASLSTAITDIAAIPTTPLLAASYTAAPTAAAVADAVWDEAVADHVTSTSFGYFIRRVYRYFFNKRTHTNTSVVVYADDGTTADATMAVSGDTTTVTKAAPS